MPAVAHHACDLPRLLWVVVEPPWPATSGGRLRSSMLLRAATERYAVTLVQLFGDPPADRGPLASVEWVTSTAGRAAKIPATARLLAARRPPCLRHFCTARQRCAIGRALELHDYELIVADTPYAAAALPGALSRPLLIVTHNVEAEAWRAATPELAGGRALRAIDRTLLSAWESATLRRAMGVAFCSERDRYLLAPALASGAARAVVPNAVDTGELKPLAAPGERREALFVGGLSYGPNREAAFFIRDEFAGLAAKAGITPLILGGDTDDLPSLRDAQRGSGHGHVEFLGRPGDVRPAYQRSYATIVPLFSGSGTRLKILESFALGRPVVSTAKGVEGLAVRPGVHYLLAETADEFVDRLVSLRNADLWARLVGEARALVESCYSRQAAGAAFLGLVEATLAAWPAPGSRGVQGPRSALEWRDSR
jgi:glycosyltransferase involved in cell wall biosynthesis